ncbi:hypothetical protein QOT17_011749 [Balamuthia mandrillaris]
MGRLQYVKVHEGQHLYQVHVTRGYAMFETNLANYQQRAVRRRVFEMNNKDSSPSRREASMIELFQHDKEVGEINAAQQHPKKKNMMEEESKQHSSKAKQYSNCSRRNMVFAVNCPDSTIDLSTGNTRTPA